MSKFAGFSEKTAQQTSIPEVFFQEILADIDHLGELKLTLYFFWRFNHMEGTFLYLKHSQILNDQRFMTGMGKTIEEAKKCLGKSINKSVQRGTLLRAELEIDGKLDTLYLLNSPKGRAAVDAIENGEWRFSDDDRVQLEILTETSNIFQLYEDNIGPLTPIIADALGDAEDTYSNNWIVEAIQIAAENNKRNWKYIEAILKRWHQEGKHERRDQKDSEKSGRRYIEGKDSEYVEH